MITSISEEIVVKTYMDVAGFAPHKIQREMEKLNKDQPDLFYFVLTSLEEMDEDVRDLGIYLFFVVYMMFKKAYKKINRVTFDDIDETYDYNLKILDTIEHGDENALMDFAEKEMVKQPYVMKYITEALMEEDDEYDEISLKADDKGFLFLFLKTITDILDKNTTKVIKVKK
ncbi:MAG TPA: hypothetical protein PLM71_05935 [Syntrophorhabdaceae bacterium]|nr:hypothetical protein [Syntrophorhabdaceae bacterium]HPU29845.1 hypothetical protein [Syntrophorhabdaceae bacterium]